MADQPKLPLWRVMQDAGLVAYTITERENLAVAVEIRALADWLVPEEAEPAGMHPVADYYSRQSIRRHQRRELRQLLLAEADRAEAGDG